MPRLKSGRYAVGLLLVLFGGLLLGGFSKPWEFLSAMVLIFAVASLKPESAAVPGMAWWLSWLAWMSLSVAHSAEPLLGFWPLAKWGGAVALWGLLRAERSRWRPYWFLGLLACALIVGPAARVAHPGFLPPNENYTAFVLAAVAAAGLGVWGNPEADAKLGRAAAAAALLALIGILRIKSRGALLGVLAALLVGFFRPWSRRRASAVVAALLAGLAALPMRWWNYLWSAVFKFGWAAGMARPRIWAAALNVAADHPFLGAGPGNFAAGFLRHLPPSGRPLVHFGFYAEQAHSQILQFAADAGLIGLALFLAAAWKAADWRRQKNLEEEAAFRAVIAMSAHAVVDNILHLPGAALLFFSALACLPSRAGQRPPGAAGWRLFCAAGAIAALAAFGARALERSCAAEPVQGAKDIAAARSCLRWFPADAEGHERLARAYLRLRPPRPERALIEIRKAGALAPFDALYPAMEAELLAHRRDWPAMLECADHAASLEPNFIEARLLRARALRGLGFGKAARKEWEDAGRLSRRLARSLGPGDVKSGYDEAVLSFDPVRYRRLGRVLTSPHE